MYLGDHLGVDRGNCSGLVYTINLVFILRILSAYLHCELLVESKTDYLSL
ncbi:hypothetical protein CKAH01_19136 [Colletotrichum kahawae]|uniref:Uncharacterized protein n=1 Tax=Colletotrichum kahawae TaxID=34407 RepID=A0AAD9XYX5_COLKA|nr:hypothetical protein CKAH01_19136 [Colletotrichum kahawae]